ncbi:hypothetical protein F2Q69_00049662 [Brassica cretica]|uniref:Uncharacterized protein n=1 Tax=Brassica cretica TaxID=69181 RepID=A0A8S9PPM8_BRACR|nr:hypothetical protein F2Q69_00049662 [Brassica cretica]
MVFHHMVLIFHSSKGFNQMVLIFHLDMFYRSGSRRLKEVLQTTSRKSSKRLPGSLLMGSSSNQVESKLVFVEE